MEKFLQQAARQLWEQSGGNLRHWQVILPSRRAGLFLQKALATQLDKPAFLPAISPIERWIEDLSGLRVESNGLLLLELYSVYRNLYGEGAEPFEDFLNWAPLLLQDLNEIDRHLIPPEEILSFLADAKTLEKWELQPLDQQPELVRNYVAFWESLPELYTAFTQHLLSSGVVYQGLAYRQVALNFERFRKEGSGEITRYAFIGFNAFNTAEQSIIRHLLKEGQALLLLDLDDWLHATSHEAGQFIRQYRQWPEIRNQPVPPSNGLLSVPKNMEVFAVPGSSLQAKVLGELLEQLPAGASEEETAIVLADENLLLPVLHSLPPRFRQVNVTMGLPLKATTAHSFFDRLLELHENGAAQKEKYGRVRYYHLLLGEVLNHPLLQLGLNREEQENVRQGLGEMMKNNLAYLPEQEWRLIFGNSSAQTLLEPLLTSPTGSAALLDQVIAFTNLLKTRLEGYPANEPLLLEYLFHYHGVFVRLREWLETYPYVDRIRILRSFLDQLLAEEPVSFYGEPLSGLQVMGMLETRALDFKRIYLLGVNEGILPTGKGGQSLIPIDIKRKYNLPTYEEKDAVYAYHFFRLLARAEQVTLLYNSRTDQMGQGEVSRFISQLEIEWLPKAPAGTVWKTSRYSPNLHAQAVNEPAAIPKTPELLRELDQLAERGFSPSALGLYLRNPLDFYKEKVLKLDLEAVLAEELDQRLLGTALHACLEEFYGPYIGSYPAAQDLNGMIRRAPDLVLDKLSLEFKKGELLQGKNFLFLTAARELLVRFLQREQNWIRKQEEEGNSLELLALEQELTASVQLPNGRPVKLIGYADRVERVNGLLRVVDYKSGKVLPGDLRLNDPGGWFDPEKPKEKALQLLLYLKMLQTSFPEEPVEAAILSLRRPGDNPLLLQVDGSSAITREQLRAFDQSLVGLLAEIFDPMLPFAEKA